MVARTGFEPVISALRGRCPSPLDERAIMAGVLGLEPRLFGTRIRRVASYTIPQVPRRTVSARKGMLPTVAGAVNLPMPTDAYRIAPARRHTQGTRAVGCPAYVGVCLTHCTMPLHYASILFCQNRRIGTMPMKTPCRVPRQKTLI